MFVNGPLSYFLLNSGDLFTYVFQDCIIRIVVISLPSTSDIFLKDNGKADMYQTMAKCIEMQTV